MRFSNFQTEIRFFPPTPECIHLDRRNPANIYFYKDWKGKWDYIPRLLESCDVSPFFSSLQTDGFYLSLIAFFFPFYKHHKTAMLSSVWMYTILK